ncbi:uncharacterized protein LOC132618384 [Lycium barbarum]|uniref:uncharacterized protein LOC132618384 n=1 Tax=Lycium barbarum TaxID=112863 RepID=UPI00293F64A4|nr:uncharacterized protein LOC132618384 [Lycium barbarum]XP_060189425.1 uncharacterized protein LOC132618384 [Lycium barbarum]XP_060189426.1 uncharacterized protein LOC132618384 [Lycium barbarum]XP_060189427.1 uncharacterized protein LOC132618384 [Lycium barbarum]XP_060189428.1 uncharacterized protein LOC132618384 [Lycium barbarum]
MPILNRVALGLKTGMTKRGIRRNRGEKIVKVVRVVKDSRSTVNDDGSTSSFGWLMIMGYAWSEYAEAKAEKKALKEEARLETQNRRDVIDYPSLCGVHPCYAPPLRSQLEASFMEKAQLLDFD